jgi:hypothetical protein
MNPFPTANPRPNPGPGREPHCRPPRQDDEDEEQFKPLEWGLIGGSSATRARSAASSSR